VPESKHISFDGVDSVLPTGKERKISADREFLDGLRILNLLTGVTDLDDVWTSDATTHTAYSLGDSRLNFIAFMLSRFQITTTVPDIPVDVLLSDDFAHFYVVGQPVHAQCLDIMCGALAELGMQWTYTGITLNMFDRPISLLPQKSQPASSSVASRLEDETVNAWAHLSNSKLKPWYQGIGCLASSPTDIPEPPLLRSRGSADSNRAINPQEGSPLFLLPAECQAEVVSYLDKHALTELMFTCKAASKMPKFWKLLFLSVYSWAPSQSRTIDWQRYYYACKHHRGSFRNRARIEAICHRAVHDFDGWDRKLDDESARNARIFLRRIHYS
ncbi:hypothetical protein GQ54DRAFT_297055, partial [Martensiomyces pterosporus]